MVQVLPYVPGFGEKLTDALAEAGSNVAQGLQRRYDTSALQNLLQQGQKTGQTAPNAAGSPMDQINNVAANPQDQALIDARKNLAATQLAFKIGGKPAADIVGQSLMKQQELESKEAADVRAYERELEKPSVVKYFDRIDNDRQKLSGEKFANLQLKDAVINEGVSPWSSPHLAEVARSFGVPDAVVTYLENPDSKQFKSAQKTFIGDIVRDSFRGTTTTKEIALAEDTIAELGVSKEGNLASVLSAQVGLDIRQHRLDLVDQLKAEGVSNSKIPATVDKMMKPYVEEVHEDYFKTLKGLREQYAKRNEIAK